MISAFRRSISILFTLLFAGLVSGEECGQEELVRCSRPLQVLSDTSELSFVTKKEELDKLCPDLYTGLRCIHSYTLRCMNLHQRTHFNRLYAGTNSVIKDLCREGAYQLEFLKHAPCMRSVKTEYELCAHEYQTTVARLGQAENQDNQNNHTTDPERQHEDKVRTVCCSFQQYMECSEETVRNTCGNETAAFTRAFLDKMASNLIKMHCSEYSTGSNACKNSVGPTASLSRITIFLTSTAAVFSWLTSFRIILAS